jgi:hypothetical protein
MGDNNDQGTVPKQVQDLAKAAAKDLLDHPDKLPDPIGQVVADAKKFPDKLGADVKKSFGGKDDPPKSASDTPGGAPPKRPGAPHVTGGPDIDPHVKLDGGHPDLRGSSAGAHVTVAGKDRGVSYSVTGRGSGGTDAKGDPEVKTGVEAGVTVKGGGSPDGPPRYSATAKIQGGHTVDVTPTGVQQNEKVRATVHGEVDVAKGVTATADLSAGFDASQGGPRGSQATPNYAGTIGLKFTPGADSKSPAAAPRAVPTAENDPIMKAVRDGQARGGSADPDFAQNYAAGKYKGLGIGGAPLANGGIAGLGEGAHAGGLSPGQQLAAKIKHDQFLVENAETPAERKLAAARVGAEEKVLKNHPELGTPNAKLEQYGLKPGDYSVVGKDGVTYSGDAVKLPDALQKEVQANMLGQTRADAQEQVQDRSRSLERSAPSR